MRLARRFLPLLLCRYNDVKKLKNKATQRRERLATQKKEKQQKKRQQARAAPSDDLEEIERRKAKFQEKKARRLARKAEAA